MKIRALLTSSVLLAGFITVVVPNTVNAAAKQTVKVYMTGDCADGQMVEGVDEDDCEITVTMTPKTAKRNAVLEVAYDPDDPEWEELDAGSTKSGRLIFGVSSTDEDDVWMDGVVLYRVRVKKSGVNKQFVSKEYKTAYTSADAAADDENLLEDLATVDPEEKKFNDKMDGAKKDNQQKINEQQPNQNITQNNNGGDKGQPNNNNGGQSNNKPQFENKPPTAEQRAGEFNRACGAIQMSKDTCNKVIAAKNGAEAIAALGPDSEKFCKALAMMACKDVMPFAFP
ncbi:MAG: hypothetical protein NTZ62_00585 [Actinobacteria bacterium]|nr:hypothetical protein [Actinomycetota bacterium]